MSAVAGRYAKALFGLATDAGALQPAGDELARAAALAADPSVAAVLDNPLLPASSRTAIADLMARELGLSDLLSRFVHLLADHQRLPALPAIHAAFQKLLDRQLGRVRVTIRSAAALPARQQTELVDVFGRLTGKQVLPEIGLDPELLGGVVVEVEGKVFDGSVRTQLDRLAKELAGGAAL